MTSRSSVRAAPAALLRSLLSMFLFSSDAHAEATLTVTISGLNYTLVDRNPDDGIDPSLVFGQAPITSGDWYEGGYARARASTGNGHFDQRATGPWPRLETSLVRDGALSTAWVDGRGDPATVRVGVTSSTQDDGSARLYALSDAGSGYLPFVLSPYTSVSFYADMSFDGYADVAEGEGISAQGSLYVFLPDEAGWGNDGSHEEYVSIPYDWTGEFALTGSTRLVASAYNDSAASVTGRAEFYTWAWALSTVPPVPEPGHLAMLAAGLGVLCLRMRRAQVS